MVFSSNLFVFLFLPLFLVAYYLTPTRGRNLTILLGSYLFYAWWRPDFLLLFVAITLWNYAFALALERYRQTPRCFWWLMLGIVGDLGALGYFKYANFGVDTISALLVSVGLNPFFLEKIILPLGISFYTFQAMAYLVDVYRGDARPTRSFINFAAFISFFPQLIAGPILRYRNLEKQFEKRSHSMELFSLGASRFLLGFVKKVLIADSIAPVASYLMAAPEPGFVDSFFGVLCSTMQLYFDFSGYSDMAIGLGMMMGFRFNENFNQPLICQSVTEFWQRWHITLSQWLRDYLYRPLKKTLNWSVPAATFATLTLAGLWHGADMAFVLWGAALGGMMVVERRLGWVTDKGAPYSVWKNIGTLCFLWFIWPLFLTGNVPDATRIMKGLLGFNGVGGLHNMVLWASPMTIFFCVVAIAWERTAGFYNKRFYLGLNSGNVFQDISGWRVPLLWAGFALAVTRLSAESFSPFLYFQF
ncbi:alginate o-acetyltransferase AlgI [Alcanivorax hongdengensis A-11-3]|uniref:Probable alginate O-acetylase n=1 Tax=Alcanivorax hongdengensis A-11-3 TaxID=1177179 RepID=L0WBQ1_9GAMM|nr:MBOAT family O-acyltransferase [Alcanivorax hongdengensis]EKF74404.1 alginate o-acetyltransferase AlgI [Alcanivorax hongdengensis A-11-3]